MDKETMSTIQWIVAVAAMLIIVQTTTTDILKGESQELLQTSADSGLARDTHAEPARTAVDVSDKEV